MDAADALARALGDDLVAASLQGAAFALAAWIVCRGSGRIRPSVQAWVWWLICGRLLVALLPIPAVPLPLLAERAAPPPVNVSTAVADVAAAPDGAGGSAPARAPVAPSSFSWPSALLAVWAIGIVLHAAYLCAACMRARRIVRGSAPASEESILAAADLVARIGLRRVPDVRCSADVASPQTLGIRRPLVLLPASADAALSPSERAMVLAHELMHVRRRDVALGWIPAVAERLFFFHPLARFAAREYLIAREAACDAGAMDALGVAPERYGELLVALGVRRPSSSFAAASAAWSSSSLKRRLEMLQYPSPQRMSRGARWSLAVAACLCLMPFQLVARPAAQNQELRSAAREAATPNIPTDEETAAASGAPQAAAELEARHRLLAARLEAEAARVLAVDQEREAFVTANAGQAADNPDTADVERAVAEMSAAIERMSRQLDGASSSDGDRLRAQAEVVAMLQAIQVAASRGQDVAAREPDLRELVAQADRLRLRGFVENHPDVQRLMRELEALSGDPRLRQEIEESLEAAEEQIAAARKAAALNTQADELGKIQQELQALQQEVQQQMERLRNDQEALRMQQRALQQELERLRSETKN